MSMTHATLLAALVGVLVGVTLPTADDRRPKETTAEQSAMVACLSGAGFMADDELVWCVRLGALAGRP